MCSFNFKIINKRLILSVCLFILCLCFGTNWLYKLCWLFSRKIIPLRAFKPTTELWLLGERPAHSACQLRPSSACGLVLLPTPTIKIDVICLFLYSLFCDCVLERFDFKNFIECFFFMKIIPLRAFIPVTVLWLLGELLARTSCQLRPSSACGLVCLPSP